MKPRVLFAVALAWEARAVLRSLAAAQPIVHGAATLWTGSCGLGDVAVVQTGIGGERAEEGLRFAAEIVAPQVVVSTGCAGALDDALTTGDVVVATEIVGSAGVRVAAGSRWRDRYLAAADRAGVRSWSGALLSSNEVLLGAEEKRARRARSGAIAVEMEALALARGAAALGAEFAAARAILDPADVALPADLIAASDAHGRPRATRLLGALARRPRMMRELVALGSMAARCRTSLAALHAALLAGPILR